MSYRPPRYEDYNHLPGCPIEEGEDGACRCEEIERDEFDKWVDAMDARYEQWRDS